MGMPKRRNRIVTLCGSTRFEPWFHMWHQALSLAGHSVFTLGAFPSHNGGAKLDEVLSLEEQSALDNLTKQKLKVTDVLFIINPFGYLGERSLATIEWCKRAKTITIVTLEQHAQGASRRDVGPALLKRYGLDELPTSPIDTTQFHSASSDWVLGPPGELRTLITQRLFLQETAALALPERDEREE